MKNLVLKKKKKKKKLLGQRGGGRIEAMLICNLARP